MLNSALVLGNKELPVHRLTWTLALLALTLAALGMRWYYVSTALVLDPVRGDAVQYYSYALNLANHATFAKDAPGSSSITPDSYRDPGYPVYLALWMKGFGAGDAWYAAVLLSQAMLGALTVTLATLLGSYWLPKRWAIFAGLVMAIWPHSISIDGYLLSETLFGFLCTLAMFLGVTANDENSVPKAAISGLVFGAAALTNAVLLPFGPLLAAFLLWRRQVSRLFFVAMFMSALLLPALWAIRNNQLPTSVNNTSSSDRALLNLVVGAWPEFHSAWRASFFGDASEKAHAKLVQQSSQDEFVGLKKSLLGGGESMLKRMSQHPWRFGYWYLLEKPQLLWDWDIRIGQGEIYVYPTRNSPFDSNPYWVALYALCHTVNFPLFLLALASLYFVYTKRNFGASRAPDRLQRNGMTLVVSLVVYVTMVYSILQAEPRYSIAFRSFEILLAVTTICGLTQILRHLAIGKLQAPAEPQKAD